MTEHVYLGRNNTIDLILKSDGVAQDLASVTRIVAVFGDVPVSSEDHENGDITWDIDGYDTGEIRIAAGAAEITAGTYSVAVIVYDPSNTDGIQWTYLDNVQVHAEVETS